MSPSRENKFTSDENLKVLLNTMLHFAKIDLETTKNKSCYQTSLRTKQDHPKRIQSTLTNRGSLIWEAIGKFYVLHLPLKDFKNLPELILRKNFTGTKFCAESKIMDQILNNFMESCSCYLHNRMFNITNTNFMVEIDMGTWRRKLISCLAIYLHSRCSLKRVTNYTLLENKMLIVGNDLCSSSQCMSMNNGFVICISMLERKDFFVPSYEWSDHSQKTWEYIWIFGIMISFICYFIIIIVYQFIIDEKSLTSTIIVFQCVTLLFTGVSLVVALRIRHHTFSCKFIGIALHWGILASQIWTAIIAFDLSSKLRSISATIIKTNSVRLAGYSITAYVTPAIIVSTCTFLQTHHLIDRGYGANGFCFISDCRLVIYFFVIPLAIIFLIATF